MVKSKKLKGAYPSESPRVRFRHAVTRGGFTLVLGAGMSIPRGIPDWNSLAKRLWLKTFRKRRSPWEVSKRDWSPKQYPQFLPIVFELVYRKLGRTRFIEILKKELYANARYPLHDSLFERSNESLAVVARLIVQEFNRGRRRRINSVITFNADDIFELAVNKVADILGQSGSSIVRAVARGTHAPLGGLMPSTIPVYHIHGFLPSGFGNHYLNKFEHMLVFTDSQYWSTSASSFTFTNRIMASALGEGRCIFIGLSMTDINLLRWLALRTLEKDRDYDEEMRNESELPRKLSEQTNIEDRVFKRHFWIRPASDDRSGFLSEFFNLRGIMSVEINNWNGDSFNKLIEESFPDEKDEEIKSK